MSIQTKIQWCHSTVNPIMGCGGCELFPSPRSIHRSLDLELAKHGSWPAGTSLQLFTALADEARGPCSRTSGVSTTNIWHLRESFCIEIAKRLGRGAGKAADVVISSAITCYAAKLHLNKAASITNPTRKVNKGYAPVFDRLTRFPGRVAAMARQPDLGSNPDPEKPWLDGYPRLIFVSDMGDAFSRESDFSFLEDEVMTHIRSPQGQRHIWLWLTKRPGTMARFGERIGELPNNVCAMTTITGPDTIGRLDDLRRIPATVRGVSAEPLWERITPAQLDLTGIDWLILGGESGRGDVVRPFHLSWARELRDHCNKLGVPFFLKQLGRRPMDGGSVMTLLDKHGGDWNEWPADLRVRQIPSAFRRHAPLTTGN